MDESTFAAALFDHPSSQPQQQPAAPSDATLLTAGGTSPTPPAPADPDVAIAEKLYPAEAAPAPPYNDSTPEEIRKLRLEDTDRKHFTPQTMYADAIPSDLLAEVAADDLTDEHKNAAVAEWRELAADLSLGGQEVKEFIGIYKQAISNPPTPEQDAQWRNESKKLLVEKYGQRADAVLGLADRLLKRDPRAQHIVKHGRLGNNPKIVLAVVEAALRESTKGRLK